MASEMPIRTPSSTASPEKSFTRDYGDQNEPPLDQTVNHGHYYNDKYRQSHNVEHLEQAISYWRQALKQLSQSHPSRTTILDKLARRLLDRFSRFGEQNDLLEAVALGQKALQGISNRNEMPSIMNGQRERLTASYVEFGRKDHLERAIRLGRDAIMNFPDAPQSHMASRKLGLASSLSHMYDGTKDVSFLTEAITNDTEAVELTDQKDPMRPARLCNLGVKLGKKWLLDNKFEDLQLSLEYHRMAKKGISHSSDRGNVINILNAYSVRLRWFFECTSDRDSLDKSLELQEEIVKKTPTTHPKRSMYDRNLCNGLLTKFEVTGELDDFHKASKKAEEAVSRALEVGDDVNRALALYTLCSTIRARYQRTGALDDLKQAIKYAGEAIQAIPENHIEYVSVMANMSLLLSMLYDREKKEVDLDKAIEYCNIAAKSTTQQNRQAMMYSNLGILYGKRYDNLGRDTEDLQNAIEFCQKSLEVGERSIPALVNLANWIAVSFESMDNDIDTLSKAVEMAEEAFEMTKANLHHPDRSRAALTVAHAREARFKNSNAHNAKFTDDRARAKEVLREVMSRENRSPPTDRSKVALSLAEIAYAEGDWDVVYEATTIAVDLLPLLSPRCVEQSDQYHALSQYSGLASRGAASALTAGRSAKEALLLLERGRCVSSGHRFENRVDLRRLRISHPHLAEEFEDLCHVLDADPELPAGQLAEDNCVGVSLSQRYHADTNLRDLVNRIRDAGFENFLQPVDPCSLLEARSLTAIVVINVSSRSDALVVKKDGVDVLHLSNLNEQELNFQATQFTQNINARPFEFGRIQDQLAWLWDSVVGPILKFLDIQGPFPTSKWPRICWVPTGVLSRLPLHAAGHHLDDSNRTTLDWVVSSYSPSLKFLQYTVDNSQRESRKTPSSPSPQRAFIVSMANTRNMAPLPGTRREARAVGRQLCAQPQICINKYEMPTQPYLLGELRHCDIFHFAGHGKADAYDPLRSSLAVADSLLTVGDLINLKLHLKPPLLAYLSACLTSSTEYDGLIDEGVHLAASFLAAGFQNVIAALHKVKDKESERIAEAVYKHIIKDGLTSESIPFALHQALCEIRNGESGEQDERRGFSRGKKRVSGPVRSFSYSYSWISYIHLG